MSDKNSMQVVSLLAYPNYGADNPVITAQGNVLPNKDYITKTLLGLTEYNPTDAAKGYASGVFILCDGKVWKNTSGGSLTTRPGTGVTGWTETTVLNAINAAAATVNVEGGYGISVDGASISAISGNGITVDAHGISSTIPNHNENTTYYSGNIVAYDGVIYRCTPTGSATSVNGTWATTSTNWTAITAANVPYASGSGIAAVAGIVKLPANSGLSLGDNGALSVDPAKVPVLDNNGQIAIANLPNLQINNVWAANGTGTTGQGMCSPGNHNYDIDEGVFPRRGDICIVTETDGSNTTTTPYILMVDATSGEGSNVKQGYETLDNWRAITTAQETVTTISNYTVDGNTVNSTPKTSAITINNTTWGSSGNDHVLTIDTATRTKAGITTLAVSDDVLDNAATTTDWSSDQGEDTKAATPKAVATYVETILGTHEEDAGLHLPPTTNARNNQVLTVSVSGSAKSVGWSTIDMDRSTWKQSTLDGGGYGQGAIIYAAGPDQYYQSVVSSNKDGYFATSNKWRGLTYFRIVGDYDSATTYMVGDIARDSSTGIVYKYINNTATSGTPVSTTAYWGEYVGKASSSKYGLVKPDEDTLVIDSENGTLKVNSEALETVVHGIVSTTSGTFNDQNTDTIEIHHQQGTENVVVQVYETINGAKHPVLVDYFLGKAVTTGSTTTYEDTEDYITLKLAAGRSVDYHVVIVAAKGESMTANS